jgi:hypothetical protein
MNEKEQSRNNSVLSSPDTSGNKYDLKKRPKQVNEYFDDQIELKDLKEIKPKSKSQDFDDEADLEISQLSDIVSRLDSEREKHMRYMEIGMRAVAVVVLFIALCIFKARNVPNVYTEDFCMRDKGHILTASMNESVNKNPALLRFFQLSSSGLMDVVFVNMVGYFALYGKTGHILAVLATFYILRAIVQGNFGMTFPEGGIWTFPGFPSFVVPYGLA